MLQVNIPEFNSMSVANPAALLNVIHAMVPKKEGLGHILAVPISSAKSHEKTDRKCR